MSRPARADAGLRVLVVEDDPLTREMLSAALNGSGYDVHAEPDGGRIERAATNFRPDIALIDLHLGAGVDGITVARRLRATDDIPFLFLTAASGIDDVLAAFDVGGDDYVVKPFAMAELLARMGAVLRRTGRNGRTVFQVGDLVVDVSAHIASRSGEAIDLTHREFSLLATMARHPGIVLSRVQLLTEVWGFDQYDPNVVEVHISALRRKLEERGSRLIQTVRGVGYVLRPDALAEEVRPVGGEEALARRCADLEGQIAELEQANEELSRFAAQAAHDLRAPIQGIAGFADLLARREGARLDEVSQGFLARIFVAVGTMRRLIESTIEHGRAATGEIQAAPVDCARLVVETVEGLGPEIDAAAAKIEIRELPDVLADRAQLGRVLHNLIANGVKFARPGQVPHIVVSGRRTTGGWQLSVTDNGMGIAPADRERIFEPFFRGPRTGGNGDGAGLGLAICKAVAERHGGEIWVEEAPGGGSRFILFLPDLS